MIVTGMPTQSAMKEAFYSRDASFDGLFYTGVRTTGIFCKPTCPARKPKPENIEFFASTGDALYSGYRPCLRCSPMEKANSTPSWLADLFKRVEAEPERRWRDFDLRQAGLSPERVRRWFQANHGMTFHAYARARRLQGALKQIGEGSSVTDVALDHGYESLSGFGSAVKRMTGNAPTTSTTMIRTMRVSTPVGPMMAAADENRLLMLEFADRRMLEKQIGRVKRRFGSAIAPGSNGVLEQLQGELDAYFKGELKRFSVPLGLCGTPFQESVWNALMDIPYGTTTHYGAIAEAIGNPKGVRAVAGANGDNRLAIIIPCHRVIGKNGTLTGYGGGLWRKRKLLDHEQGLFVLANDQDATS